MQIAWRPWTTAKPPTAAIQLRRESRCRWPVEKKVVASDGWRLRAQLAAVARTSRVFLGNDRELQRYLAAHREPEAALRLWDTRNRDLFERFLDEVDRLHRSAASNR